MRNVFWALLMERSLMDVAVDAMLDVATWCGHKGYSRIAIPYTRTDMARNSIVKMFMENSHDDNDALIMLDCDHAHPVDIVERLAAHDPERGVVGALYFRRGSPYDPLFFFVEEAPLSPPVDGGILRAPAEWEHGKTYECDVVATGAICIRRWVFDALKAAGIAWPYFRYVYPEPHYQQTEDVYFGLRCKEAGVKHYCDTSLIIPHLAIQGINLDSWVEARRLEQQ